MKQEKLVSRDAFVRLREGLVIVMVLLVTTSAHAQDRYPENDPISSYPTGLYYQPGPGANNATYNWTYPYGTKLTIVQTAARNMEITTTYKNGEGLAFRQWSEFNSAWSSWKNILTDDPNTNKKLAIGVSSPLAKLHVHESTVLGSNANDFQPLVQFSGSVGNNNQLRWNLWSLRDEAGSSWSTARLFDCVSVDWAFDDPATAKTWWSRYPHKNIQSWGNGVAAYMTLKSGMLGIGVDDPVERLEVAGRIRFRASPSGHTADNVEGLFVENNGQTNGSYVFQTATVGGGKSFSITNAGRIGIGTTAPDAKLTVKGNIHAEEVMVDLNVPGPDYVFEEDYPLLSLAELKAYVTANKHLPEVPSAAEMEDNGINVGEMNLILLKKIEELTLHVIRQQEEIDALKKQLANND